MKNLITRNSDRIRIFILALLCIVSVSLVLTTPALAAGPWSYTESNSNEVSMSVLKHRISATYKFVQRMAAPFAVLAITGGGLMVLCGSEKDADKGYAVIKTALLALLALYLLPLVISAAYNSLNGAAWNPATPDFTW